MTGPADIGIVSLGTTLGWLRADAALADQVRAAGASCEVATVRIGPAGALRRHPAATDVVEGLAARRAARGLDARALVYSSVTAALLQPPRRPFAVRFDSLAIQNRPGAGGAWQRPRERAVLARARLLLPWSEEAAEVARELAPGAEVVVLPPPVEEAPAAAPDEREPVVAAYAGNPDKRGLDLLMRAWAELPAPGARLVVCGLERTAALRFLGRRGVPVPGGVEWAGSLPRAQWLSLVGRAAALANASVFEDWGIAPMEALSAGTPLATVASGGPYEALAPARRLAPELVAERRGPAALAAALRAAVSMDGSERARYAHEAAAVMAAYRPDALARTVAESMLPRMLA